MTRNLVIREAIQVSEKKKWDWGTEINSNYELVIKNLIIHFFPPKAIQRQKIYLCKGIYKPCYTNICEFICRIDEILD